MSPSLAAEQHYTPNELASLWQVDPKTVRRMFQDEPGVLRFGSQESRYKRGYISMRIPASVAARVHQRLCVGRS
jgi:hypothetical protein